MRRSGSTSAFANDDDWGWDDDDHGGRGLHSSTFQLNLSASRGIGEAFRGRFEGDQGV